MDVQRSQTGIENQGKNGLFTNVLCDYFLRTILCFIAFFETFWKWHEIIAKTKGTSNENKHEELSTKKCQKRQIVSTNRKMVNRAYPHAVA